MKLMKILDGLYAGRKFLNFVRQDVEREYGHKYTEKQFTPKEINHGWCDLWAERFIKEYGGQFVSTDITDGTGTRGHAFVKKSGKYYDVETTKGVKDYFDLPYFKRAKKKFGKDWDKEEIKKYTEFH